MVMRMRLCGLEPPLKALNHVSPRCFALVVLLGGAVVGATACEPTTTGSGDSGGDGGPTGPTFTEADGYPELTGPPVIASASAAKGTEIKVTIPYDSDTRSVRLDIRDFRQSTLLVPYQNEAQRVGAGGGSFQATFSIPSTTVQTDTYYFTIDLCSSDAYDAYPTSGPDRCGALKRTTYARTGTGATYTRVGYTSPPLTQSDGPRDSGITIPTFAIQ